MTAIFETSYAELKNAEAEIERLRKPWQTVDDYEWSQLSLLLPNSGHGQFWKKVLAEMRVALQAKPKFRLSDDERHSVAHAQYLVGRATDDNPNISFDYELIRTLLKLLGRLGAIAP